MRIAVYTICKNEEKFVSRFMDCIRDEADDIIVTDTGSTDQTVKMLRDQGAVVHEIKVDPWRFDVPRNVSLQVVPKEVDVCVCIDLDEVLTPGWRKAIEAAWTPTTTRLRYPYIWNTLPDGREGTTFWYDKIHLRNGYRWVKPVHEILNYSGTESETYCDGFKLYHYPDATKSRGSYLPLLELGCRESPDDDRNSHYLGREYMFYGKNDEAIAELQRHLAMPRARWEAERAASMRYIARCFTAKGDLPQALRWAMRSVAEAPTEREPWVDLGKVYYYQQNWEGAYYAMTQAINIGAKPMSYICEPEAWGGYPHDIAAVAAFNLGHKNDALKHAVKAANLEPHDERIQKNVLAIQKGLE